MEKIVPAVIFYVVLLLSSAYAITSAIISFLQKRRHNTELILQRDPTSIQDQVAAFLLENHISDIDYYEVMDALESIVKLPKNLILPSDRLGKEIFIEQPDDGTESDKEWILNDLNIMSNIKSKEDFNNIVTIGDIVLLYKKNKSTRVV